MEQEKKSSKEKKEDSRNVNISIDHDYLNFQTNFFGMRHLLESCKIEKMFISSFRNKTKTYWKWKKKKFNIFHGTEIRSIVGVGNDSSPKNSFS